MTTNYKQFIGRHIIAPNTGIGEITDVVEVSESLFFSVNFEAQNSVNLYPVNNNSRYRMLSSKDDVQSAIKIFNNPSNSEQKFESVKDMINYYKEALKSQDIGIVSKNLSIMNKNSDLHMSLKKNFEQTLESLIQEIQFVLKLEKSQVLEKLSLNKA